MFDGSLKDGLEQKESGERASHWKKRLSVQQAWKMGVWSVMEGVRCEEVFLRLGG